MDRYPATKPKHVLIVDDHADSRGGLRALLELEGYRVDEADTAAHAIDFALTQHPDAIVLDLALPDDHGCRVAERVRAAENGHRPLLIAFTGWGRAGDRERAQDAGFDAFVLKPGNIQDVLAALRGKGSKP